MRKVVFVKMSSSYAKAFECNEFSFHDVDAEVCWEGMTWL